MKHKFLYLFIFLLFCIPFIQGATVTEVCNNITNLTSVDIHNVTGQIWDGEEWIDQWENLTVGPSCWMVGIESVKPIENFTINISWLYNVECGGHYGLYYPNIVNSTISIVNDSTNITYGAGNYSIELNNYTQAGTVRIIEDCDWVNQTIRIDATYNFTSDFNFFNSSSIGVVNNYYNNSSAMGMPGEWLMSDYHFDEKNWTVTYIQYCQNCSNYTTNNISSCRTTQTIIFSAFGLIILAGLVAAAFVILQIIGGNFDASLLSATVVGLIMLSIIIMIGYIIIAQLGLTVCV